MTVSATRFLLRAAHIDRALLIRFVLASLARSALSMGILLLIQQFLAGVLAGQSGLAGYLAMHLGRTPALYAVAGLLLLSYLGASALTYEGQMVEQRIIRAFELGLLDRLVRHLLTLSVGFFERQSQGDLIQAIRVDVTKARTAAAACVRIGLESALALGYVAGALWISPRAELQFLKLAEIGDMLDARKAVEVGRAVNADANRVAAVGVLDRFQRTVEHLAATVDESRKNPPAAPKARRSFKGAPINFT